MERYTRRPRDLWTGLVLLALTAVYVYGTFQYSSGGQGNLPNARTLPLLLAGVLFILALGVIWDSHAQAPRPAAEPLEDERLLVEEPSKARLGITVLILFAYLLVMPRLGFAVTSIIMGVLLQKVVFRARIVTAVLTTVFITGIAYWIFDRFLQIPLP